MKPSFLWPHIYKNAWKTIKICLCRADVIDNLPVSVFDHSRSYSSSCLCLSRPLLLVTQRSFVGRVRSSRQNCRLKSLKFQNVACFKPKVKTVAEKLSFVLHIWLGNLTSQLLIFSPSTIFTAFSCKSLAGFLFKFFQSSRRRKPELALDVCVWPLCDSWC